MRLFLSAATLVLLSPFFASAQNISAAPATVVPHLVRYSGTLPQAPAGASVAEVKFAIYAAQSGSDSLWSETQYVSLDAAAKYSVMLGTAKALPDSIFASGEARWVGVTLAGQPEGARTALAASAYALKASDSETLGGHPAADFVLAPRDGAKPASATNISQIDISPGITGGGTGPTVTLGVDLNYLVAQGDSVWPQLGAANTFSKPQTINGNLTVNGTLGGTALNSLVSAGDSVWAQLAARNTFAGQQTFNAPVSETSTVAQSVSTSGGATSITNTGNGNGLNSTAQNGTAVNALNSSGNSALIAQNNGTGPAGYFINNTTGQYTLIAQNNAAGGAGYFSGGSTTNPILTVQTNAGDNSDTGVEIAQFLGNGTGCTVFGNGEFSCSGELVGYASSGPAIQGIANQPSAIGVSAGYSVNSSEASTFPGPSALLADGGLNGNVAVEATSDSTAALFASDSIGQTVVVYNTLGGTDVQAGGGLLINTQAGGSNQPAFEVEADGGAWVAQFAAQKNYFCVIDESASLTCSGSIKGSSEAVIDGTVHKLSTTAMQGARSWVEDADSGQLVDGRALVHLHTGLVALGDTAAQYQVFLTPGADCAGLYVAHKKADSFEVHELNGGHSNISFDYRVLVSKRGDDATRFQDVTAKWQQSVDRVSANKRALVAREKAPEKPAAATATAAPKTSISLNQ